MTPDELRSRLTITVDEAAAALGLGRTATYDAVRRGEIPSVRLGRRVLIPTGPLLEMLGAGSDSTEDPVVEDDERPRNRRYDADQAGAEPDERSGAQVVELR